MYTADEHADASRWGRPKFEAPAGFETADGWVKTQRDVRAVANGEITLTPSDLGGASHRVYYFGGGYKTK